MKQEKPSYDELKAILDDAEAINRDLRRRLTALVEAKKGSDTEEMGKTKGPSSDHGGWVALSDTLIKLKRCDSIDKMCLLMAECVFQSNPGAYVLITLFDPEVEAITIRHFLGFGRMVDAAIRFFGKDPRNMSYSPDEMTGDERRLYTSGRLELINGGLYALSTRKLPRKACEALEALLGVEAVYSVGFALNEMPYGGVVILERKGKPLRFRLIIEILANQISFDDVHIGEYAVLSVSDDGPGISPVDLARIFEPFYTKKVMGRSGTGTGLAVVWNVMQDHKGYIDVKSDENGTTFELFFPTTRDEISDKDLSIPMKDFKGDGEKILIVDDVESQRDISCRMLETLGYKTKAVSSGEAAVEYLKDHTVHLILLDMIMDPGINGRETYERIGKIHPNQKAIIISGFAESDEVKSTQKSGAGRYIKKPFALEKIGLAIKEELEK